MKNSGCFVFLLMLACIALFAAGCTSSAPATTTPAPTVATAAPAAAGTPAAPAPSTTQECPDELVWDAEWDTRVMEYAGNHDIRKVFEATEGQAEYWTGPNAPSPTEVKITQKCWDVTGTIEFTANPVCSGTLTGTIDKNQLTGSWKTDGCEPFTRAKDGKYYLTMAADNKSWMGKFIATEYITWCPDCPPNWAGKKV